MLYNFPALTGQDLTPALVKTPRRLAQQYYRHQRHHRLIARLRSMIQYRRRYHPHFTVLCGYDDHLFNTLLLGGDGAVGERQTLPHCR